MGSSITFPTLSASQIEQFRSQVRAKRGTAFLAPQLVEQIQILNDHLTNALKSLAAIRDAASDLALAFDAGELGPSSGPSSQDERVRVAMKRLCFALGDSDSSDPDHPVG